MAESAPCIHHDFTSSLAAMAANTPELPATADDPAQVKPPHSPNFGSNHEEDDTEPPHDLKMDRFYEVDSLIRGKDCTELLSLAKQPDPVNLMEDPLLSLVITIGNTDLAVQLIRYLPSDILGHKNFDGDTALHVAATHGDCRAAIELLKRKNKLIMERNKKQEIPLHKAALYGQRDMFWCLIKQLPEQEYWENLSNMRREDGATMLHCAIMGNEPALALEIARQFPHLITSRNDDAVTPLQLMVTIPEAFRSQMVLGTLDNFLYKCIPLEDDYARRIHHGDEEKAPQYPWKMMPTVIRQSKRLRSDFPSQYSVLFDLFELMIFFPGRWIQCVLFNILRPLSTRIQDMEKKKKIHRNVIELVGHLAAHPGYFDFITKGSGGAKKRRAAKNSPLTDAYSHSTAGSTDQSSEEYDIVFHRLAKKLYEYLWHEENVGKLGATMDSVIKEMVMTSGHKFFELVKTKQSDRQRWNEPPLTLGARMGLDDYVIKIMKVYPQSATLRDTEGRSVLQVAIKYGRKKIVRFIREKFREKNPILPSWLLSSVDHKTQNTILHIASEKIIDEQEDDVFKMQQELKWFELVKEMVPRELVMSRNARDKTAQENFTENHKEMVKRCKTRLIETGKTCCGLVAAVVFASSFSIPGEKNSKDVAGTLSFRIFSHAYLIGVSCATTSLVVFLSIVISSYEEQQFRRAIPTKYFFAFFSFVMAMVALLLSFTCSVLLQLNDSSTETKHVLAIVLQLLIFPIITILVLLYRGCTFYVLSLRGLWD